MMAHTVVIPCERARNRNSHFGTICSSKSWAFNSRRAQCINNYCSCWLLLYHRDSNLSPHKAHWLRLFHRSIEHQLTKLGQKNASNDRSRIAMRRKCLYWNLWPAKISGKNWSTGFFSLVNGINRENSPFHLTIHSHINTSIHKFEVKTNRIA